MTYRLTTAEEWGNSWVNDYIDSEAFVDMLDADGEEVANRTFATAFAREIMNEVLKAEGEKLTFIKDCFAAKIRALKEE